MEVCLQASVDQVWDCHRARIQLWGGRTLERTQDAGAVVIADLGGAVAIAMQEACVPPHAQMLGIIKVRWEDS